MESAQGSDHLQIVSRQNAETDAEAMQKRCRGDAKAGLREQRSTDRAREYACTEADTDRPESLCRQTTKCQRPDWQDDSTRTCMTIGGMCADGAESWPNSRLTITGTGSS